MKRNLIPVLIGFAIGILILLLTKQCGNNVSNPIKTIIKSDTVTVTQTNIDTFYKYITKHIKDIPSIFTEYVYVYDTINNTIDTFSVYTSNYQDSVLCLDMEHTVTGVYHNTNVNYSVKHPIITRDSMIYRTITTTIDRDRIVHSKGFYVGAGYQYPYNPTVGLMYVNKNFAISANKDLIVAPNFNVSIYKKF